MATTIKNSFLLYLTIASSLTFAQAGLGIGSQGLLIKSSPDAKYAFMGRLGFQLGTDISIRPQINVIGRIINELNAKLYSGVGAGFLLFPNRENNSYEYFLIRAPLGVEWFPFQGKLFSVTIETGLDYFVADSRTNDQGNIQFGGLAELTFYVGRNRRR